MPFPFYVAGDIEKEHGIGYKDKGNKLLRFTIYVLFTFRIKLATNKTLEEV